MTLSSLPLSYCTNVHPGRTVAEVENGLDRYTVPIRENFGSELAAGLWLAAPVVHELAQSPDLMSRFADGLRGRGLTCYTLNAFPYGDFHSARVKENVYLPDWTQPNRSEYTLSCARILAELLPEGVDGSISTVPLGFKSLVGTAVASPAGRANDSTVPEQVDSIRRFVDQCADRLIEVARGLDRLKQESGRTIRLAIEPEPLCVIETTDETLQFFERLRVRAADAGALDEVMTYLGVCYDVCHQAVEFEDVAESIRSLAAAAIRINKVHITCAIEISLPGDNPDAKAALSQYVEPRYLHQTFAQSANGQIARQVDLNESLTSAPPADFRDARMWRVHFHVPVDAEHLGPLGTTRGELKRALAVIPELNYAPHLEVETYTWEVFPGGGTPNIVDGFTRELLATQALLKSGH